MHISPLVDAAVQKYLEELNAERSRSRSHPSPWRGLKAEDGGEVGPRIAGEFRLRLFDVRARDALARVHGDWDREELLLRTVEFDTGWTPNVVTDFGRRFLLSNAWTNSFNMFIGSSNILGTVRRTTMPGIYASQTPNQARTPDTQTFDTTLLLQTRTVEFPAPAVARVINVVGLTNSVPNTSESVLHGLVAYTHLTATVNEGTTQAADLQYKVTWSLD